tara:strand:- start:17714 stop:17995 length:282 start_codon:yes stop_codon:yes gene_type:complete
LLDPAWCAAGGPIGVSGVRFYGEDRRAKLLWFSDGLNLKWFNGDCLTNCSAANALSAYTHAFIGAIWLRDADTLKVGLKFTASDPGDLGTYTT